VKNEFANAVIAFTNFKTPLANSRMRKQIIKNNNGGGGGKTYIPKSTDFSALKKRGVDM
jgi:hypothetical protein